MGVVVPQVVTESKASGANIVQGGTMFDHVRKSHLMRTPASAGNRNTFTWSCWIKKSVLDTSSYTTLISANNGNGSNDGLFFYQDKIHVSWDYDASGVNIRSSSMYRDTSGWYHIVWATDTTSGTASQRMKIYVNGEQVTLDTNPDQNSEGGFNNNTDQHIGVWKNSTSSTLYPFDGYMAEMHFVDGQQLEPSAFGYTDQLTNTWRPKKFEIAETSGGVYGTNGFYLPLDGTAPVGSDQSGLSNNWSPLYIDASASIDKATGALPINRCVSGGKISTQVVQGNAGVGVSVYNAGSGNKYYFDGKYYGTEEVKFVRGQRITFNTSDSTVATHPFRLSTTSDGTHGGGSEYTDGRVTGASEGGVGAATTITIPHDAPNKLYYYCTAHSGMGGVLGIGTDVQKADLYAWKNVLAMPLSGPHDTNDGKTKDVSPYVNCTTSLKTAPYSSSDMMTANAKREFNFYSMSAWFDGSADKITASSSSDFTFGTGDFTFEAWVHPYNLTNRGTFIDTRASGGTTGLTVGHEASTGEVRVYMNASSGSDIAVKTTNYHIQAGYWYHVAVTRSSGTVRLFINGDLVDSASRTSDMNNTNDILFGYRSYTSSSFNYFTGYMNDVRLYKGVAKYTETFLPASSNPGIVKDSPSGVALGRQTQKLSCGSTLFPPQTLSNFSRLYIADSSEFNYGNGDFTLECWIMPTQYNSDTLVHAHTSGGDIYGPCNLFMEYGMLYLYMSSNNSSFDVVSGGYIGTPDVNNWSHVAVSRSGNTIRAFMNGKCNHTTTSSATLMDASGDFQIGYRNNASYFKGFVCDFRVVVGTAVYKQEFTPPTSPLAAIPQTVLLCCESWQERLHYVVSPNAVQEAGTVQATPMNPYDTDVNVSQGPPAVYPTLNDRDNGDNVTLSRGALYYSLTAQQMLTRSTMAIRNNTGAYYWEYTYKGATPGSVGFTPGIVDQSAVRDTDYVGETTYGYGLFFSGSSCSKYNAASGTSVAAQGLESGDVIMIYYNSDYGLLWFGIEGTWYNGGGPTQSSNVIFEPNRTVIDQYYPAVGGGIAGAFTGEINFGQRPFKYNPPWNKITNATYPGIGNRQCLTLSTHGLPDSGVVRGDSSFDTILWTGNSSTRSITDLNFQPDLVWIKDRDAAYNYVLQDSVRGAGATTKLASNLQSVQGAGDNELAWSGYVSSFNYNGFTLDKSGSGAIDWANVNKSSDKYVAWCWKAGGNKNTFNVDDVGYSSWAATGISGGDITPSGASINTKAGFSIIKWIATTESTPNIPHGLGKKPKFWLIKNISGSSRDWIAYTTVVDGTLDFLNLNNTDTISNSSADAPTTTTFGTYGNDINTNGETLISYVWTEIPGYSKFGTYEGNGDASGNTTYNGPFVYTGFRPALVIVKSLDSANDWNVQDNKRMSYNGQDSVTQQWNSISSESTIGTGYGRDYYSNGFKITNGKYETNKNGETYLYAAWAEDPFKNLYGGQANAR